MQEYNGDGREIFKRPPRGQTIKTALERGAICERTGASGRARILLESDTWLVDVLASSEGYRCVVRPFESYGSAIYYFNRVVGRFSST